MSGDSIVATPVGVTKLQRYTVQIEVNACLMNILLDLNKRFRYAVEVRDSSWFQDLTYSFFANNNMCMVWSQLVGIRTPPIVTTEFLDIRFK